VAAVLLYTAPAIVMVLSYFLFGEKMTKRKVTALFMTLLGCALVTGVFSDWGSVSGLGILTGLGAGLGYALYSIFSRYALERGYHFLTITFYTFLVATIFSFAIGNGSKAAVAATSSLSMIAFSCAFGVLCTVVPYLAYTAGLKYVENSKASIFASIEPVTATILGIVVFHESVSLWEMLGMALVIGALVVCNGERSRG
jgi:drug/metabolite transporter (DMT)-like permease